MTELIDTFFGQGAMLHLAAFLLGSVRIIVFVSFAPFLGPQLTATVMFPIVLAIYLPLHPLLLSLNIEFSLNTFSDYLDLFLLIGKEALIGYLLAYVCACLFYVALTRAKEKMIMVVPEFKKNNQVKGRISYLSGMKYRSFYDFLASISLNLSKYMNTISLDNLALTKDYELNVERKITKFDSNQVMEFKDVGIMAKLVGQEHASKNIARVLSTSDAKTLEYGTKIHEKLEETDFKHVKNPDIYVKHLLDTFDFETPDIYQELEFFFIHDGLEYHGIIDLMLEYDSEIKIIDYKLKNIEDEAYIKQLNVYYEYMRSVSDKKISLYLYSILDNQVKEVEVLEYEDFLAG